MLLPSGVCAKEAAMPAQPMNKILNTPRFLKVGDVAKLIGSTTWFIYEAIKKGDLRACRFGRLVRIRSEDFEAWASGQTSQKQETKNV